jgi:hypothetical protein
MVELHREDWWISQALSPHQHKEEHGLATQVRMGVAPHLDQEIHPHLKKNGIKCPS